jgi:hypothetical protein
MPRQLDEQGNALVRLDSPARSCIVTASLCTTNPANPMWKETSLTTVDEAVAALARSTYQRGAVSSHVGADANEVRSLKRYIDALLGELLEIT